MKKAKELSQELKNTALVLKDAIFEENVDNLLWNGYWVNRIVYIDVPIRMFPHYWRYSGNNYRNFYEQSRQELEDRIEALKDIAPKTVSLLQYMITVFEELKTELDIMHDKFEAKNETKDRANRQ